MGCSASIRVSGEAIIAKKQRFKVLVMGPANCGKTSMLNRYIKGTYESLTSSSVEKSADPTIGVKFLRFDRHYSIELWDIPSNTIPQRKVRYMEGTDGILVVADVTQPGTFRRIQSILKGCSVSTSPTIVETSEKVDKKADFNNGRNLDKNKTNAITGNSKGSKIATETDSENTKLLSRISKENEGNNVPVVLFVNKIDRSTKGVLASIDAEIKTVVKANDLSHGLLGSVATNVAVNDAFEKLLRAMVEKRESEMAPQKSTSAVKTQ